MPAFMLSGSPSEVKLVNSTILGLYDNRTNGELVRAGSWLRRIVKYKRVEGKLVRGGPFRRSRSWIGGPYPL